MVVSAETEISLQLSDRSSPTPVRNLRFLEVSAVTSIHDLNYMENGSLKARSIVSQNYLDDDCIVLDGDPDKPDFVNDTERNGGNGSDDLCIVGQRGQVACRDFPHSRHLCASFPFNTTSHEKHCKLCHCYVCDSPAPCVYWGNGASLSDHCHATDKKEAWKSQRKLFKKIITKTSSPQNVPTLQPWVPRPMQSPRSTLHQVSAPITNVAYLPPQIPYQNMINPAQRSGADDSALAHSVIQARPELRRVGAPRYGLPSPGVNRASQASFNPNQMNVTNVAYQNMINPAQRSGADSSALARPIIQARPESRRVGAPGYGLPSSGVNRASRTSFKPNQMNVSVPRRPMYPFVTSQAPQNVAAAAACDTRKWQDIVAGLAAELGVSDYVTPPYSSPSPLIQSQYNSSSQGNRPYLASPPPLTRSQDNGLRQRMAVQTNVGRAVNLSNSLGGAAGQNVDMGTFCADKR